MTVTSYGSFSFLDNGSRNGCLWLLGILCSYGNIESRSAFCWLWLLVSCSTIEDRYGSHKAGMVRPAFQPWPLFSYWDIGGYLAMAPLLVLFFFKYDFLDFFPCWNIWGSTGSLFAAEILIVCLALSTNVVPFIFLGYWWFHWLWLSFSGLEYLFFNRLTLSLPEKRWLNGALFSYWNIYIVSPSPSHLCGSFSPSGMSVTSLSFVIVAHLKLLECW